MAVEEIVSLAEAVSDSLPETSADDEMEREEEIVVEVEIVCEREPVTDVDKVVVLLTSGDDEKLREGELDSESDSERENVRDVVEDEVADSVFWAENVIESESDTLSVVSIDRDAVADLELDELGESVKEDDCEGSAELVELVADGLLDSESSLLADSDAEVETEVVLLTLIVSD